MGLGGLDRELADAKPRAARRVAVAAWRLARADRLEIELFEERGYANASPGLALIRDGNGTRSFETLPRYRGAAMAEFWRALKTLKALQAEQAAMELQDAVPVPLIRPAGAWTPNEPERRSVSAPEPLLEYVLPDRPAPDALHEPLRPGRRTNPRASGQATMGRWRTLCETLRAVPDRADGEGNSAPEGLSACAVAGAASLAQSPARFDPDRSGFDPKLLSRTRRVHRSSLNGSCVI